MRDLNPNNPNDRENGVLLLLCLPFFLAALVLLMMLMSWLVSAVFYGGVIYLACKGLEELHRRGMEAFDAPKEESL